MRSVSRAWFWALVLVPLALPLACSDPLNNPDGGTIDATLPLDGPPPGDGGVIPGSKEVLLLKGTVVTPDTVIAQGEVLIENDTILCVAASCAADPRAKGATVVDTAGIIAPGLIDAHNHTQYNYLPPWKHTKLYSNHNQWQAASDYKDFTTIHRQIEGTVMCEMVKYGEIRSLVAGTTTIQGTPLRKCADTLIRNADLPYHGFAEGDTMRTNVLGVSQIDAATAQTLLTDFASGKTRSYVIHLSEGIDETARKEFDVLESFGLLQPQVVVIHGTALTQTELTKMKSAGMPLIWSPSSNLDLYGATNDIAVAQNLGLLLALAPDWTPSGDPNVLDELRTAWDLNQNKLGQLWQARDLVQMVTSRAAEALRFDKEIGSLKVGMRADVVVLAGDRSKPYDAMVAARLPSVRLVLARGKALYGEPGWMTHLSPNAYCESVTICGVARSLCIKENESTDNKLNQTLGDIETILQQNYTPGIMPLSTNCQ